MKPSHFKAAATALTHLAWLLPAAGCGSPAPTPPVAPIPASEPDGLTSYPLRGEVVRVDRETRRVSVRHEEIPDYMPPMTMEFPLAEIDMLDELQPGDRIAADLRVGPTGSSLDNVIITELGEPPESAPDPALAVLKPGATVPDFLMRTQDDETLRLSDLHGRVVVLTFIYTRCPLPDYCPLMDRKFADLARRLRASPATSDATALLSISFDPEHDRPEALARHAAMVGARPPLWRFTVADHEELRKVAPGLGLSYGPRSNEIIHSLSTAVVDPTGRLAALYRGNTWKVDDVFKKVRELLAQPGADDTVAPTRREDASP